MMEAVDKTDDVPLLIPSIHMYRTHGKTITKDYWVTIRIASAAKAEAWRAKSAQYRPSRRGEVGREDRGCLHLSPR